MRGMRRTRRSGGFTLIELLIVIIIIGILAAIAIPMYLGQRQGAKDAAVKSAVHVIQVGLGAYDIDHNTGFPASVNESTLVDAQGEPYVDNWPTNPYSGGPIAQDDGERVLGGFSYVVGGTPVGSSYIMSGHLSRGQEFVVE